MSADRLFRMLVEIEERLEQLREDSMRMDPHDHPGAAGGEYRSEADARALARHLRGIEAAISNAARDARDAQLLLRPHVTPRVAEDPDHDPARDVGR